MKTALLESIRAEARGLIDGCTDRRVVVWGAGELGAWLMRELGPRGVAFVDRNPTKLGETVAQRPVYAVEELGQLEFDEIWVSVLSDCAAICDELRALGLDYRVPFPLGKRRQFIDQLPRTLRFLERFELEGRTLLEVGCGGQLYLSSTLLHLGAQRMLVSDVTAPTGVLGQRREEWLGYLTHLADVHPATGQDPNALLERIEMIPHAVDAAELPFADASLDGVVSTGVMEHVARPKDTIREMARVLRPGGLALCLAVGIHDHRANDPASGFTPWSFLAATDEEWQSLGDSAYHQNRWRAIDFERAFRAAGFEILACEATADSRLTADEVGEFAREYREGYTLREFSELDLFLAARRSGG